MSAEIERQIDWSQCPIGRDCREDLKDSKEDARVLKAKVDKIFGELTDIKVKQAEIHAKTAFWATIGFVILSSLLGYLVTLVGEMLKNHAHGG